MTMRTPRPKIGACLTRHAQLGHLTGGAWIPAPAGFSVVVPRGNLVLETTP